MGGAFSSPVDQETLKTAGEKTKEIMEAYGKNYLAAIKTCMIQQYKKDVALARTGKKKRSPKPAKIAATILDTEFRDWSGSKHVVYTVEIKRGASKYVIRRLHSEFRSLGSELKEFSDLPKLSRRRGTPHDEKTISERKKSLQEFLNKLVSKEKIEENPKIKAFLALTSSEVFVRAFRIAYAKSVASEGIHDEKLPNEWDTEANMMKRFVAKAVYVAVEPGIEAKLPENEMLRAKAQQLAKATVLQTVEAGVGTSMAGIEKTVDSLKPKLDEALKQVAGVEVTVREAIKDAVQKALDPLMKPVKDAFAKQIPALAQKLLAAFPGVKGESLSAIIVKILTQVENGQKYSAKAQEIINLVEKKKEMLLKAKAALAKAKATIEDIQSKVGMDGLAAPIGMLETVLDILVQQFDKIDPIKEMIKGILEQVDFFMDQILKVADGDKKAVDDLLKTFKDKVKEQWDKVEDKLSDLTSDLSSKIQDAVPEPLFAEVLSARVEALPDLVDSIIDGAIKGFCDGVRSSVQKGFIKKDVSKVVAAGLTGMIGHGYEEFCSEGQKYISDTVSALLMEACLKKLFAVILPPLEGQIKPLNDKIPAPVNELVDVNQIVQDLIKELVTLVFTEITAGIVDSLKGGEE